ncbi:hypothetical protein [Novosphingobium aquimarinum]|uniref:hypothetical protein n=1 Tax=Novosphingobium aquimarinum TaxID=2682494 RepID=UPI0012EB2E97|nr:hypothetical protein [Novosphingobium aquimarinum]
MAWKASRATTVASLVALTATLAGCGPDDARVNGPDHYALQGSDYDWPLENYGFADSGAPDDFALPPLPDAQPMAYAPRRSAVSYARDYGYAPRYYDDAPDYREPDPSSYVDNAGTDTFAYLALAALLGGVLDDSPPDYYFDYDGVQPWAWQTGDRYTRYAEPIRGGDYRYYYYEPNAARPFLVRDPYYSYGYRNNDLVVVYDRYGRVLDRNRVRVQRRVASRYFDRGAQLYRAGESRRHRGIAAPLWQRQRAVIERDQRDWERARANRDGWRNWTRSHEPVVETRWAQEQAARRYAANRFDRWRSADYRGSAPRFYREARQQASVRRAVAAQEQRIAARERRRLTRMARADKRGGTIPAVLRRQQIEQRAERRIAATKQAARIERRAEMRRASLMPSREDSAMRRQLSARRLQRTQAQQQRNARQALAQQRREDRSQLAQRGAQQKQVWQRRAERTQFQQRRAERAQAQQQRGRQALVAQRRAQQAQVRQQRAERAQARRADRIAVPQRRIERAQAQQRRAQQAQATQRRAERSQAQQRKAQQAQVQQRRAERAQVQQRRAERAQAQQRRAERAQVQQRRAQQAQVQQRRAERAQAQQRRAQQAQVQQRRAERAQVQQRRAQQAQVQQRRAERAQAQQRRAQQAQVQQRRTVRAQAQQQRRAQQAQVQQRQTRQAQVQQRQAQRAQARASQRMANRRDRADRLATRDQ